MPYINNLKKRLVLLIVSEGSIHYCRKSMVKQKSSLPKTYPQ
jgi:hypothetical protein